MLVLTRKTGQQIVLPNQGITIDVVEVSRTQVRLGIAAPSDVPIHRREVWDRRTATEQRLPASENTPQERAAAPRSEEHSAGAEKSSADLGRLLTQRIIERTGGRISQLSVEPCDGQIVVRGHARSSFARQMALAAVQEVVGICDSLGCPVGFEIDVGQVYWRSIGRTTGLTKFPG